MPDKYSVIRDTREQVGHGWMFPPSNSCLGTVIGTLKTADYTLVGYETQFCLERKGSVQELAGNLTISEKWDDFKNELTRLEQFEYPFVICEFSLALVKSYPVGSGLPKRIQDKIKVTPQFLLKRLEEIWVKFRTKFIFADNKELGQYVASGLFKRIVENVEPKTS